MTKQSFIEIDRQSLGRERVAAAASPFAAYRDLTLGKSSLATFMGFELATGLLGPLPGGVGILLRQRLYAPFFARVGKGVIIGRNVVFRHPDKIVLGDRVIIDDNCLIDARGAGEEGMVFESGVVINRGCMLQAKAGPVRLGTRTSLGSNSVVVSMAGVDIGDSVLIAGGCYLSAGNYRFDRLALPVLDQEIYSRGPIRVEDGAWLGTRVTLLDGITVGRGAIVGAGALVNRDIPPYGIAFGVPARVKRNRAGGSVAEGDGDHPPDPAPLQEMSERDDWKN